MKIYALSGLGADKRVFSYLRLDHEIINLDWIQPTHNESIVSYAHRLSSKIDTTEDYGIMGVSFGGLVAVEISKILNPNITILISSAETNTDLRRIFMLLGKTKLLRILPKYFFDPPRFIAFWLFGAKNKKLLNQILNDTDLKFAKWAVNALVSWKNQKMLGNKVLKINGKSDKLIPVRDSSSSVEIIEGGAHFMIVDRAEEISVIINQHIIIH